MLLIEESKLLVLQLFCATSVVPSSMRKPPLVWRASVASVDAGSGNVASGPREASANPHIAPNVGTNDP